jgi:2-C-methyl-D-erythritol 4-phosphate cytidylyltransferase
LAALTGCPAIERVWVVLAPDDPWWPQFDWSALGSKLETVRCGRYARRECDQRLAGGRHGGG